MVSYHYLIKSARGSKPVDRTATCPVGKVLTLDRWDDDCFTVLCPVGVDGIFSYLCALLMGNQFKRGMKNMKRTIEQLAQKQGRVYVYLADAAVGALNTRKY